MGVRLPAEYQEVTCIIGKGTQYIDTGYVLNSECRVQGRYDLYGDKLGSVMALFGARDSDYNNTFAIFNVTAAPRTDYGKTITTHNFSYVLINDRNRVDFDLNAGIATVNGRTYAFSDSLKPFTCPSTALIFAAHTGDTIDTRCPKGEIVYLKITNENGIAVRDMIPCYRKSDDEPGMYDLVSGTFFTNQGTGEFLVGPDVVNHISPRLIDRRRALIAKLTSLFRKVITSQTGLVTFDTNVAKPMKVTCEFSPKQDLHGYDNPWPAGGGKNLLPFDGSFPITKSGLTFTKNDKGEIIVNGTSNSIDGLSAETALTLPAGEYKLSGLTTQGGPGTFYVCVRNSSNTNIVYNSNLSPLTFTLESDTLCVLRFQFASRQTFNNTIIKPMLYSASNTDDSYAPYENICPIEAWDGVNITGTAGKNLLNKSDGKTYSIPRFIMFGVDNYGDTVPNKSIKLSAGQYTISVSGSNSTIWESCYIYDENNTRVGLSYNKKSYTFTLASTGFYFISITISAENFVSWDNYDIQLERGSTQTTYEPFMGATLPVPFNNPGTYDFLPVQAGTGDPSPENIRPITPGLTFTRDDNTTLEVYGGSLTVNADGTGSLVSSKGDIRLNGASSENWQLAGGSTIFAYAISGMENTRIPPLCNRFVLQNPYGNAYNVRVNVSDTSVTTVSDFKAWLANNELHVVYPLETPTTYTLSVSETSRAFEALGLGKNLGPLYGGTVTVNEDGSVDVVADIAKVTFNGTQSIGYFPWHEEPGEYVTVLFSALSNPQQDPLSDTRFLSDKKRFYDSPNPSHWRINHGFSAYRASNYSICMSFDPNVVGTTKETLNAYLAENPITVTYPVKTPGTYHFSSIADFKSFIGSNNVWSDLNGAITVEYYKKQQ